MIFILRFIWLNVFQIPWSEVCKVFITAMSEAILFYTCFLQLLNSQTATNQL